MNQNVRNVLIVLALAGLVVAVPAAGVAVSVILFAVSLVFLGSLAWFASVQYREHRATIFGLGDRNRAVLYASIGLVVLDLSAYSRLWYSGASGRLVFLSLLAVAAFGLFGVYRAWRSAW